MPDGGGGRGSIGGPMNGGGGGSSGGGALASTCSPIGPGPCTVPTDVTPGVNTTVMFDPSSAFPTVVTAQATVIAPAATAAQGKPSNPTVVEKTATGMVPAATPPGTFAVRVQVMLPVMAPWPCTPPTAWQTWPMM